MHRLVTPLLRELCSEVMKLSSKQHPERGGGLLESCDGGDACVRLVIGESESGERCLHTNGQTGALD